MAILTFDQFVQKSGGTPDAVKAVTPPGQPPSVLSQLGDKTQTIEKPSLASKLGQRVKNIGSEALTLGTLGANTLDPNTIPENKDLAATEGLLKAAAAPAKIAMQAGGAIGDIVGAGLHATGIDKPLGKAVAPIAQSISDTPVVQKAKDAFHTLSPEVQDYLKGVPDLANLFGVGEVGGLAKNVAETGLKAAKDVVPAVAKTAFSKLAPDAEVIMQRVARIPKGKQASFEQMSGDSVGSFLDKRGIYGDTEAITQKLFDRFQTSKQTADDALAQLQGTYRAAPVRTALTELEGKVERTSSPGAPDADLRRVKELVAKERTQGLTMSEINEAKRLYERRVRLDYLKTNAPEDVTRATNVDNALREWQMAEADKAGLTNLKEINKETQSSKFLLDAIGKENAGSAGNNAVGLTDWIVLSGGDPHAISAFLVKKGFSNKDIQSWIAKNFSKNQEKIGVPEAQFKEKLQLEAPAAGAADLSNEVPINLGKSQTQADINLDVMNAKKATPQGQEILQESYPNSTPVPKESKGITLKNPRGFVDFKEWLPKLESDLSFASNAKTTAAKMAFTEDVASKLNEAGIDVGVVTEKNMDKILNIANEFKSLKRDQLKQAELNTPGVKMMKNR